MKMIATIDTAMTGETGTGDMMITGKTEGKIENQKGEGIQRGGIEEIGIAKGVEIVQGGAIMSPGLRMNPELPGIDFYYINYIIIRVKI